MVIRWLVGAVSLGLLVLSTSEAIAQGVTPTSALGRAGLSFATPDGLFRIQPLGSPRQTLMPGDDQLINSLVWSPDGEQLAVVENYGEVFRINSAVQGSVRVFASSCQRPANLEVAWQGDRRTLLIQQRCTPPDPDGQSHWEVFLANLTGQLTAFTGLPKVVQSDLYVSPDGLRLAYVANQHIYMAPLDGRPPRQLTREPGRYSAAGSPLVWSPDGSKLAFYEGSYPFQRINLIEVASGRRRVLTPEAGFQIYRSRLIWSPDGRTLAFYQPANPPFSNQEVITLIQIPTGERRIITRPGFYNAISWSPDSQRLAFAAGNEVDQQTLFLLDLATNQYIPLTPQPFQAILESRWSSQGDWIGFTGVVMGDALGTQVLHVVRPDGTGFSALTQANEYVFPFAWIPSPR